MYVCQTELRKPLIMKNTAVVLLLLYQGWWTNIQCVSVSVGIPEFVGETDANFTKTRSARSVQLCPKGWSLFGEKCYMSFGFERDERSSWDDANRKCLTLNTTMVSIHSSEENGFITTWYKTLRAAGLTSTGVWLGLHEDPSFGEKSFRWSDNSPLDYLNWADDQPMDWNGQKQECVEMWMSKPGKWNDEDCTVRQPFFCQISLGKTCVLNPCVHGALCTQDAKKGTFRCTCSHGYAGQTCGEKISCSDDMCKNGGTCTQDGINGVIRCSCIDGYRGHFCEEGKGTPVSVEWKPIVLYTSLTAVIAVLLILVLYLGIQKLRKPQSDDASAAWKELRQL